MPNRSYTMRSVYPYGRLDNQVRCWFCHQVDMDIPDLDDGEEKLLKCFGCGCIYILTGSGESQHWYLRLLRPDGLSETSTSSQTPGIDAKGRAIEGFLNAYDANAPISDAIQALRDAVKEA